MDACHVVGTSDGDTYGAIQVERMDIELPTDNPIFFFDGVCNLCNGAVDFVIRRDRKEILHFASLQSDLGQRVLAINGMATDDFDSFVLVEDGQVFTRSTAALRVARHLRFPWFATYLFIVIPRFLRDPVYAFIARNRFKWFGKRESCRLPSPDESARLLS